jgi:hypothetical protein
MQMEFLQDPQDSVGIRIRLPEAAECAWYLRFDTSEINEMILKPASGPQTSDILESVKRAAAADRNPGFQKASTLYSGDNLPDYTIGLSQLGIKIDSIQWKDCAVR